MINKEMRRAEGEEVQNPLSMLLSGPPNPIVAPISSSTAYSFYLSGEILSPEKYVDWFNIIRNASEDDIITIHINSTGGEVATAIQFRRVLLECSAPIIGSVEGDCMSAATMILLACDRVEISPGSLFMVHNYSAGVVGKGGEMYDQISYYRKWSEKLMKNIYEDFLTDAEIAHILDNKDLWIDEEDVVKRLERRVKAMKKKHKKSEPDVE